jgi:hypothetical protein
MLETLSGEPHSEYEEYLGALGVLVVKKAGDN